MPQFEPDVLLLDDDADSLELSRRAVAHYVPERCIHCAYTIEEAVDALQRLPIQLAFWTWS